LEKHIGSRAKSFAFQNTRVPIFRQPLRNATMGLTLAARRAGSPTQAL
jgi:hypothetical protein